MNNIQKFLDYLDREIDDLCLELSFEIILFEGDKKFTKKSIIYSVFEACKKELRIQICDPSKIPKTCSSAELKELKELQKLSNSAQYSHSKAMEFYHKFLSLIKYYVASHLDECFLSENTNKINKIKRCNKMIEYFEKEVIFSTIHFKYLSEEINNYKFNLKTSTDIIMKYISRTIEIIESKKSSNSNKKNNYLKHIRKSFGIKKTKTEEDYSDAKMITENCYEIKIHYLDKKDSYNSDDITTVINSLKNLNVCDEIVEKVSLCLNNDLKDRFKEKKTIVPLSKHNKYTKKEKVYTTKELREIEDELSKYYDMKNKIVFDELNMNQILSCLKMIKILSPDITDAKSFLKDVEYKNSQRNPIEEYNDLYEKFKFYEEKLCLKDKIEEIEEFFKQIFICNKEDYEFLKNLIQISLNEIKDSIPKTYEYELKKTGYKNKKRHYL